MATFIVKSTFILTFQFALLLMLSVRADHRYAPLVMWKKPTFTQRYAGSREAEGDGSAFEFGNANFSTIVESAVDRLNEYEDGLLLIHTTGQHSRATDTLIFVRERQVAFNVSLSHPVYDSLSAISHLPVSAVTALIPEVMAAVNSSVSDLSNGSREALQQIEAVAMETSRLLQDGAFEYKEQSDRQSRITQGTRTFISSVLSGAKEISRAALKDFGWSVSGDLQVNAKDAVRDYLVCLNSTITDLLSGTITEVDWRTVTVAVPIDPFTQTSHFIIQYYQQLLGGSPDVRVFPLPMERNRSMAYSDSLDGYLQHYSFATAVEHLNYVFSTSANTLTSPHCFLSDAASEILCTELYLPSCNATGSSSENDTSDSFPPGFDSQEERIYVIVIVYTATLASILLIVLSCVCLEGRKMKLERRSESELSTGPNVFSPVIQTSLELDNGEDKISNLSLKEKRDEDQRSVQTVESSLESDPGLRPASVVTHSEVTL